MVGGRQPHTGAEERLRIVEIVAVNRLGQVELAEGAGDLRDRARLRRLSRDARCRAYGRRRHFLSAHVSPRARHRRHWRRAATCWSRNRWRRRQGMRATLVEKAKRAEREIVIPYGWNFKPLDRRGEAAATKVRAGRARRPPDGECARRSVSQASRWTRRRARCSALRPQPGRTRRAPAASAGASSSTRSACFSVSPILCRRKSSPSPDSPPRPWTITMQRWCASPAVRPPRFPAPRRLPKGQAGADRPAHLRLGGHAPPRHRTRAAGASPPRRQGRVIAPMRRDRAATACDAAAPRAGRPLPRREDRTTARRARWACGRSRCSMRCIDPPKAGAWRTSDGVQALAHVLVAAGLQSLEKRQASRRRSASMRSTSAISTGRRSTRRSYSPSRSALPTKSQGARDRSSLPLSPLRRDARGPQSCRSAAP